MIITIIPIGKKEKLLVKIEDNDLTIEQLRKIKSNLIKAYKGQWVVMSDGIKLEKLI